MPTTVKWIGLAVLLTCGAGLGIAGAVTNVAIVEAVNAQLPPQERFNPLGWWLSKTLRLHREYRRLYPSGGLLRRQGRLAMVFFGCFLAASALLGLGLPFLLFFAGVGAFVGWWVYFRRVHG